MLASNSLSAKDAPLLHAILKKLAILFVPLPCRRRFGIIRGMEDNEKKDASEPVPSIIPRDELMEACTYFEWKEKGQARGVPQPRIRTFPMLKIEDLNAAGSFRKWVRGRIIAVRRAANVVPAASSYMCRNIYRMSLADAQRIAELVGGIQGRRMVKTTVVEKVSYLPDDVSYKMGLADGTDRLEPLLDDRKKLSRVERKLAKGEALIESLRVEIATKNEIIAAMQQRLRTAREFYAKCRDFARDYCRKTEDNVTDAVQRMMAEDWFFESFAVHNDKWWPKGPVDGQPSEKNPKGSGRWKEVVTANIRRDVSRWKQNGWRLHFERN